MPILNRNRLPQGIPADKSHRLLTRSRTPEAEDFLSNRGVVAGLPGAFFPRCANPRCSTGWLRLWRSRLAPVFESGWCCSPACTQAEVEAALGREMEARGSGLESHRHRIPLGLAMLEQGWITKDQLREALKAQKAAGGGRLGYWLIRRQYASEELVTRALGLQWSSPVLTLENCDQNAMTVLLPRLFLDAFGALPLRIAAGRILYLGFEGRIDPALALAAERMTGLHVESGLVRESSFRPVHTRMLNARFPIVELIEAASEPALVYTLTKAIERVRPVESRLARVHECLWLRMWLRPQSGVLPELDSVQDLICSSLGD
jgi:hypothetical protein